MGETATQPDCEEDASSWILNISEGSGVVIQNSYFNNFRLPETAWTLFFFKQQCYFPGYEKLAINGKVHSFSDGWDDFLDCTNQK